MNAAQAAACSTGPAVPNTSVCGTLCQPGRAATAPRTDDRPETSPTINVPEQHGEDEFRDGREKLEQLGPPRSPAGACRLTVLGARHSWFASFSQEGAHQGSQGSDAP